MGERIRTVGVRRMAMVVGATLALLGVGFLAWQLGGSPSGAESVAADALSAQGGAAQQAAAAVGTAPRKMVMVYVSGEVAQPGIYRLPSGLRVSDAIAAAGGLLADADPDRLPNLAGRLTDGKQVKVPILKAGSARAPKVDINSAGTAQLAAVPGIDAALAQAIVDFRQAYGPYASVTELKTDLGLDTAALSAIRKYLTAS